MAKAKTKNKTKKNVIEFDDAKDELCAINLDDFDYAEIAQIKTSDIYTVDIWNDQDALIGEYIVTSDVAEKLGKAFEKIAKERKEIKKMKPKVINKRLVQFSDIYDDPYEVPEKDIYGVEIQLQDCAEERKLIYYAKIASEEDDMVISRETYDFFLKILEKRVAAKNEKNLEQNS